MDTVTILRDLWRLKPFVAAVAMLAVLAGVWVGFKVSPSKFESRRYVVGVASARILVDTPSSQVVEVSPKGSDALGVRANLLASLMVDGVIKAAIAQQAGLKPAQLVGMTDAATSPAPAAVPEERSAFILKTQVLTNTAGDQLPIIEIDAQAPTVDAAGRLAGAAVNGLRDYLNSKAAIQRIPDADRLQVDSLGAPQASLETRGPSKILAAIAAIFVFVAGCGAILLVTSLVRGLRAAAVADQKQSEREPGRELEVIWPAHEEQPLEDPAPPAPVTPTRPKLVRPARRVEVEPEAPEPEEAPAPPRHAVGRSAWDAPLRAARDE
jgi:hypothetical protein